MSTVNPTDKVLINRAGIDHSAPAYMSTVKDTDLLLINRAGVDYKCTFADWKASQASINKPTITSPADGAGQPVPAAETDPITAVRISTTDGLTAVSADAVGYQGLPNDNGAGYNGTPDKFFANTTYGSGIRSVLAECQKVFYGLPGAYLSFSEATNAVSGKAYQRAFISESGNLVVSITPGVYVFYAGDHTGSNARHLVAAFQSAIGTFKEEISPAKPNFSRYVLTVTAGGTVKLTSSGGVLYVYATSGADTIFEFASTKGFGSAVAGGLVNSKSGGKTALVSSVDTAGKRIHVQGAAGWIVGDILAFPAGAVAIPALGETPAFTSSAFSAVGAVTHASSDWQVTLATDTTFASPVVQSMADAANLARWNGGPLQTNTDYIVRVRHNGTRGISSAWSAVVAFKTKTTFP